MGIIWGILEAICSRACSIALAIMSMPSRFAASTALPPKVILGMLVPVNMPSNLLRCSRFL